jgi:hypothetical protein
MVGQPFLPVLFSQKATEIKAKKHLPAADKWKRQSMRFGIEFLPIAFCYWLLFTVVAHSYAIRTKR